MDWTQSITIIGITVAFFIFMMNRMDANQKQTNEKFYSLKKDASFLGKFFILKSLRKKNPRKIKQ